jgi:hypothetical protein
MPSLGMMPVAQVPVSKLIRHYRGSVVAAAPAWFCCRSLAAPLGTAPDGFDLPLLHDRQLEGQSPLANAPAFQFRTD